MSDTPLGERGAHFLGRPIPLGHTIPRDVPAGTSRSGPWFTSRKSADRRRKEEKEGSKPSAENSDASVNWQQEPTGHE